MPIYEFVCRDCGELTNVLVKTVGSSYEAHCRHCDSANVERTISGFAYHRTGPQITDPRKDMLDRMATKRHFEDTGTGLTEEGHAMMDKMRKGDPSKPITQL